MNKYMVPFEGFVYVVADNEEEAREMAEDGNTVYEETVFHDAERVYDFTVEI